MSAEQQYLDILKSTLDGIPVFNERTQSNCLTLLNQSIYYNPLDFPLVTTRKSYWKQAICEMIAYIRGYSTLEEFHSLGVHTWDANVLAWDHPNNYTKTNAGLIYGASARRVGFSYAGVISAIKNNPSDRGIIWNFWNPEYFDEGCLRPCMFNHQFNVLNGGLYLTSTQRSCDLPLGGNFNMIQVWFLLMVTARLTNTWAMNAWHNITNCHIYENQVELVKEQLTRKPYDSPKFIFKKNITLEDIMININKDNFDEYFGLDGYQYHPPIKYPFTV